MPRFYTVVVLVLILLASGWQLKSINFFLPYAEMTNHRLASVKSWVYWLQDPVLEQIAQSPYDLAVIDYSYHGDDAHAFSAHDINSLQQNDKLVLAYLSIGEAENYRFYWQNWIKDYAHFTGSENPNWAGNFHVQYWQPAWWTHALQPYIDRILAAGFDGLYLDIVDEYLYHGDNITQRADQMVKLVSRIAEYARSSPNPDFIICPQNAFGLLEDASPVWRDHYLTIIDCVGSEELYYPIVEPERMALAQQLSDAGKLILNVEYLPKNAHADYHQQWRHSPLNLIGYAADQDAELDDMTPFSP